MISKKEAVDRIYLNQHFSDESCHKTIDDIYDSRGTCGECEQGHTTKAGKGFRICDDGKGLQKKNWYCADFERRQDD